MLRKSALAMAVVACLAAFVVSGCGSSSSSSSAGTAASATSSAPATTSTGGTSLPTTKFVLHFGLAGGAFHRYIYKPFKAGDFSHPLLHKLAVLKAALAAAFVYHELKLAVADAQQSSILRPLVAPLDALGAKFAALKSEITSGHTSASDINGLQAGGGVIGAAAAAKGYPVQDVASNL
jgi:hypothetical protein